MINESEHIIEQTQNITSAFSTNIISYVIFISLVFLLVFIILGWQLLNIFKSLLHKILEDVLKKLDSIETEVKNLRDKICK